LHISKIAPIFVKVKQWCYNDKPITYMETIKHYELSIGDYCIFVNITVELVEDYFDHEFGRQDASTYELRKVELSEIEDKEAKFLLNLDYIREVVEDRLGDICNEKINPHSYPDHDDNWRKE
jgi:hypothetical protein